jgi:threonine dehydratase
LAMEVIWENVQRIVAVSDEEIAQAMRDMYDDTHNLAEGAGAAAFAAACKEKDRHGERRIGVVLTGGNVDRQAFAEILAGRVLQPA